MNVLQPRLLGLALTAVISWLPAAAHAWWACPSGMQMQLRNNNTEVRCYAEAQFRNHDACSSATHAGATIGTAIRRDFNGNHDKCVGAVGGVNVIVVDPSCMGGGPGYSLQRRTQPTPDRCRKPASEAIPNVNR